jgi:hypothetical protein
MLTFADLARAASGNLVGAMLAALDQHGSKIAALRDELERERDRRVAAEEALDAANDRAEARLDVVRRAVKLAPSGVIERALDNVLEDIEAIVAER